MAETATVPSVASGGGAVAVRRAPDLAGVTVARRAPAALAPKSVDREARTAQAIVSAGATVRRHVPGIGLVDESIDTRGIKTPPTAPLNLDHDTRSVRAQVGIVSGFRVIGDALHATLHFDTDPAGEEALRKVEAGQWVNVSFGYHYLDASLDETKEPPLLRIRACELVEVSLVNVPADPAARVRSFPTIGDFAMSTELPAAPSAELPAGGERTLPPDPVQAERERCSAIERRHRALGGGAPELMHRALGEGWPAERFVDALLDRLAAEQERRFASGVQYNPDVRAGGHIQVRGGFSGDDPNHVRSCVEDVLAHRLSNGRTALPDHARPYRGLRLPDLCRHLLEAEGERSARFLTDGEAVRRISRSTATRLLTTSDFPALLANASGKALLPQFEDVRSELLTIAFKDEVRDFKPVSRMRPGEFPQLLKVNEGGEYTYGALDEGKETFAVAKWGRMLGLSWEAQVNDDLGAFQVSIGKAALAAATLEAQLLAGTILANPLMSDGNAVFSAAHGNLATSGAGLSVASIAAARAVMRLQKGVDGTTAIDIRPSYLVVPVALQAAAEQILSEIAPATTNDSNAPVKGLQIVSDPRLDAGSATSWYLFGAPNRSPSLVIAFLAGTGGTPTVETRDGWTVDATEIKVRHVVGTAFVDWRPAYKNPGA